jgi:hypothetical protein
MRRIFQGMATRILVFDPLNEDEISATENVLEQLLRDGFELIGTVGGNSAAVTSGRTLSPTSVSEAISYVVLILSRKS